MSKYTYISSSILACSCGGQLVQLPGSECVNPATRRPASTFFPITMFNSREEPGPPALNFSPGSCEVPAARKLRRTGQVQILFHPCVPWLFPTRQSALFRGFHCRTTRLERKH